MADQQKETPFFLEAMEAYLTELYEAPVTIKKVTTLGEVDEADLKGFGYGHPLLLRIAYADQTDKLVFHTLAGDKFGHERPSDRARNILLDYANFNKLPHHVPAVDVGTVNEDGRLTTLRHFHEFFLLTRFVPGRLYAKDLQRLAQTNERQPCDETRVNTLVNYLVKIHGKKNPDATGYRRCIRDLLGLGEGIMGITDSYKADDELAPPARLQAIEEKCIAWRWRLKEKSERLSQIHGDFHPWNVLFQSDDQIALLDRSRGEWGEPADDLSAMTINYILFALQQDGRFAGHFQQLFAQFWQAYVQQSGDEGITAVVPPFFTWRALVLANPIWYPNLDPAVRAALLNFAENVLAVDHFEPDKVNSYLQSS